MSLISLKSTIAQCNARDRSTTWWNAIFLEKFGFLGSFTSDHRDQTPQHENLPFMNWIRNACRKSCLERYQRNDIEYKLNVIVHLHKKRLNNCIVIAVLNGNVLPPISSDLNAIWHWIFRETEHPRIHSYTFFLRRLSGYRWFCVFLSNNMTPFKNGDESYKLSVWCKSRLSEDNVITPRELLDCVIGNLSSAVDKIRVCFTLGWSRK